LEYKVSLRFGFPIMFTLWVLLIMLTFYVVAMLIIELWNSYEFTPWQEIYILRAIVYSLLLIPLTYLNVQVARETFKEYQKYPNNYKETVIFSGNRYRNIEEILYRILNTCLAVYINFHLHC